MAVGTLDNPCGPSVRGPVKPGPCRLGPCCPLPHELKPWPAPGRCDALLMRLGAVQGQPAQGKAGSIHALAAPNKQAAKTLHDASKQQQ